MWFRILAVEIHSCFGLSLEEGLGRPADDDSRPAAAAGFAMVPPRGFGVVVVMVRRSRLVVSP